MRIRSSIYKFEGAEEVILMKLTSMLNKLYFLIGQEYSDSGLTIAIANTVMSEIYSPRTNASCAMVLYAVCGKMTSLSDLCIVL